MKWIYLFFAVTALMTAQRYGLHAASIPDGTAAGFARQASDIMVIEALIAFGLWEYTRRNPLGRPDSGKRF